MALGEKLRDARIENSFSQEYVARKLKISRQAISRWENNRGYPDIDNLVLLCVTYKRSMEDFLMDDPELKNQLVKDHITRKQRVVEFTQHRIQGQSEDINLLVILVLVAYVSAVIPLIGCLLPLIIFFKCNKSHCAYKLVVLTCLAIIAMSGFQSYKILKKFRNHQFTISTIIKISDCEKALSKLSDKQSPLNMNQKSQTENKR